LTDQTKKCFVIMPISDVDGYDIGHFNRVYEFIIKPACIQAGFTPLRADEVNRTNFIALDIIKEIIDCDMAVCDLSGRNPNVLYELGIRQAFNKPVTLIKDRKTPRIFDIQGLRDIEYDHTLRIDTVQEFVNQLSDMLVQTYNAPMDDVNSLIKLLGISAAAEPKPTKISADTSLLLNAIEDISVRLSKIENTIMWKSNSIDNDIGFRVGDRVQHRKWGIGEIINVAGEELTIQFSEPVGERRLIARFAPITKIIKSAPHGSKDS
jgi:hypothetical protein